MGPKAFITCYVCFREFGSRSIPFHEPKCLERWRSSNRSLPPEKRASTPVKPVGWKYSTDTTWLCTNCRVSVPSAKRGEHAASCFAKSSSLLLKEKLHLLSNKAPSPKKGKENQDNSNNNVQHDIVDSPSVQKQEPEADDGTKDPVSTSNKSIRPQTKILRRPTPNLKHPVIQVDSDESGDSSDKSKDDNPKRMKHSSSNEGSSDSKPKNFIMYNKYNVEKNTKTSPKDRANYKKDDMVSVLSIPFPCNSCSRSVAPERLHSHSKRDARGLMLKKTHSTEAKTPSPTKKLVSSMSEDCKKPSDTKSNDKDNAKKGEEPKSLTIPKTVPSPVPKKGTNSDKVCYICHKEPGSTSISVHEKKCLERWKKANRLLSPSRRKPLPQKPQEENLSCNKELITKQGETSKQHLSPCPQKQDSMGPSDAVENKNSEPQHKVSLDPAWQAVQSQLIPCPSCGRTFFPERLPVHQRVCKGKAIGQVGLYRAQSMKEHCSTPHIDEDSGDRQVVYVPCFICGRSFGTWVIQMHESQCMRKWRRENEKLPEHLQQQEPHITQPVTPVPEDNPVPDVEVGEEVAWESHLQQLVPCPRCGRTFFPDRLEVHERSCKGLFLKQQSSRSSKAPT